MRVAAASHDVCFGYFVDKTNAISHSGILGRRITVAVPIAIFLLQDGDLR